MIFAFVREGIALRVFWIVVLRVLLIERSEVILLDAIVVVEAVGTVFVVDSKFVKVLKSWRSGAE